MYLSIFCRSFSIRFLLPISRRSCIDQYFGWQSLFDSQTHRKESTERFWKWVRVGDEILVELRGYGRQPDKTFFNASILFTTTEQSIFHIFFNGHFLNAITNINNKPFKKMFYWVNFHIHAAQLKISSHTLAHFLNLSVGSFRYVCESKRDFHTQNTSSEWNDLVKIFTRLF